MTKAGRDRCNPPIKENRRSVVAAVVAILSELDGVFTLKEQSTALKAFLLTGFSKTLVEDGTLTHI